MSKIPEQSLLNSFFQSVSDHWFCFTAELEEHETTECLPPVTSQNVCLDCRSLLTPPGGCSRSLLDMTGPNTPLSAARGRSNVCSASAEQTFSTFPSLLHTKELNINNSNTSYHDLTLHLMLHESKYNMY